MRGISEVLLLLTLGSTMPGAVVGTSKPPESLSLQRVAALPANTPASVRTAWKEYVDRSGRQLKADRDFLEAELRAAGMAQATIPPNGSAARSIPMDKPAEWYATPEARRIADIIVSFQTPAGGWSKNLNLADHPRRKGESFAPDNGSRYLAPGDFDTPHDAQWNYVGTLDNDATSTELRYLAKVAGALGEQGSRQYRVAFERGVEYLLAAQFPNGGWPQIWPLQGGYHDAITYNDGALVQALEVLARVAKGNGDLAFVPEALRQRAAASVALGIECIVASQIRTGGKRTVWGQQHDALSLQPIAGRNYEPAAQSSGESAGVVAFLMSIEKPSPAVEAALRWAMAWFHTTAISGMTYVRGTEGKPLAPSAGAAPLWARFYSIGPDLPIFGDRDQTIHDDLTEISAERRRGYSWYNSGAQGVLASYTGWQAAHPPEARVALADYLDGLARVKLEERRRAVARIQTREEAERRKAEVRQKVLQLIGGLSERRGPVAVKQFGTVEGEGFRVEKLAYESLPGFWVTANLYIPASGSGPFPAVILGAGHGPGGKTENWNWGANFARNGILALAYDPLGQGERIQYYDAQKKASMIGGATGEHGEANVPTLLIGDDVARYFVNDAMRGIDYLVSRKDVAADRIGAFGCSGGGTATAYLAALDDRVHAAATACYITSFQELLASETGVQEAEQSIPHFIEQGLDFADWVEAAAPRPYAIVSTTDDMFPFAGARQSYEEASRWYGLYGAADRLQWITGPGPHGNLMPIAPAILTFFVKNLKGGAAEAEFTRLRPTNPKDMQCTADGQIGGETVASLNRKRAAEMVAPSILSQMGLTDQATVRSLTRAAAEPGKTAVQVRVEGSQQREGYRVETVSLMSDGATSVPGQVALPDGAGKKPAVLLWGGAGELDRLARSGHIVMALEARPAPAGTESVKSSYLGSENLLALHAFLVGKTLVGLRVDDVIRAVDWLSPRASSITVYGEGAMGMVVLHAAVLDTRITRVVTENPLTAYRMIVDQPLHRNVSEVVIPGVLRWYDTAALLQAIAPRVVTVINPKDAMGEAVDLAEYRKMLGLEQSARVKVMSRAPGDPLPVE